MLFLLQITDQLGAFSLGHSISIRRVQTLSTQPSAGPTGFDTALTRHTDHFSSVCVLASRIRVNSTQECKMNKVYKSVWNESIGAWVAVSENSPARGKRSGRVAKAALASAMTMGVVGGASASVTLDGGTVTTAPTGVTNGVAIGSGSNTTNDYGVAMGAGAKSSGVGDVAIGADARALSGAEAGDGGLIGGVAVGSNAKALAASTSSFGALAVSSGVQSTALGSHATATGVASTAIGMNALADRDNTVSIGNATTQRQLVQVARGTQTNDAVNVSQLTPLVSALGGDATLKADGSVTGPAYTLKGTTYNTVGDALTALADSSGSSKYFHVNSTLDDSTATGTDSIAIGGAASSALNGDIAIGSTAKASGMLRQDQDDGSLSAIAIGSHAVANNSSTLALGGGSEAHSDADVAIGAGAIAFGIPKTGNSLQTGGALAVGTSANAANYYATAIGYLSKASAENSVALGATSIANRDNTVSVGSATQLRQIVNVGAGTLANDAVNVTQLQNVTTLLGGGAKVNADGTIQAPAYTVAGTSFDTVGDAITKVDTELTSKVAYNTTDKSHVTLGGVGTTKLVTISNVAAGALSSTSTDAVNGSQLNSTNQNVSTLQTFATNINNGGGIKFFHTNSTLADSSATGADSVAIGGAAAESGKNAVALGSNSVAGRDNTVSVGAAGKERQITNVEAGTASTDAVNVGQLTAVSNNVDTLDSFAVKYDTKTDGTTNYEQITLGGAAATKPTLLTNLASGKLTADSTDAVNGSQLYATNQNVAALQDFTNNVNNGGGIKHFHSNSTLADSSATGADSVAIGGAALSSGKNSVALGSNSVADRDNSVSVGAAGSERQLTNVAAGTASIDAANVGQLNAVSSNVTSLSASAIKYDTNADGTPDYANATLGNGNTTGTALHNVAAATGDMDAVNLGQLNDMMGQVTNLANGAYNPLFTADGDRNSEVATSSGTHSVASGANAMASGVNAVASGVTSVASGSNAVALGANTSATANNAVAVGANASATANNSVALGAGSVADRANAVSVGTTAAGGQRQVTNVAAGTDGTDAVNVNQMQQSVNTGVKSAKGYTDALRSDMNTDLSLANNHINSVGAMSSAMAMMAGSAAAVADKDNRFAAGTGVYRNKAAIALGFQKRFGTNMVITVGGSTTGEESTGGAGFAFGF